MDDGPAPGSLKEGAMIGQAGRGRTLPPVPCAGLAQRTAYFLTHYAGWVHAAMVALLVGAALVIIFGVHFASDVLDLFPSKFDSVKVWKISNREFAQGRSLSFALLDETGKCDLD